MLKRTAVGTMVALLLTGMLSLASNIQPVIASGKIYIKADGSVDPSTAPIQRNGNIYTFTGDIYDFNLEVLKDNIVIDGAGHKIEGEGTGDVNGIMVSSVSGLKIKNIEIKGFRNGIAYSSNNSIIGNKITSNWIGLNLLSGNIVAENEIESNTWDGIRVQPQCADNTITGNNISSNSEYGIYLLAYASQNVISNNSIVENGVGVGNGAGVLLSNCTGNIVSDNYISNNSYGITSELSSVDNKIYHNNFIGNVHQSNISQPQPKDIWDDGYPCGGNYWSDYTSADLYSGSYQNETGSDGIGDTQYVVDDNNQDNYPLMNPWSTLPVHNINTGLGYTTIQESISANETLNGHTIFVERGIYYEHVVVNKTVSLIGESRDTTIVDGNGVGNIVLVTANNTFISGFTIQNGLYGIWLDHSDNNTLRNNSVSYVDFTAIFVESSSNNIVAGNVVSNSDYGIRTIGPSYYNLVEDNILSNNYEGIGLNSNYNNIIGNTFSNNTRAINLWAWYNNITNNLLLDAYLRIEDSNYNRVYHNSFYNITFEWTGLIHHNNIWDDGYPSGGNYWSDYAGIDNDGDCIGDSSYFIDENNTDNYPLMNPWASPDIAVVNLTASKTVVGEGFSSSVYLTVENQGNKIETFDISVYANTTLINSQVLFLRSGNSTILTSKWNTAGLVKGNYTISAHLEPIPSEIDIGDNNCTDGAILVTIPGDVTGDIWVDMQDISILIDTFMANPGDPRWNLNCDINGDLSIDMLDISIAIYHFMQS